MTRVAIAAEVLKENGAGISSQEFREKMEDRGIKFGSKPALYSCRSSAYTILGIGKKSSRKKNSNGSMSKVTTVVESSSLQSLIALSKAVKQVGGIEKARTLLGILEQL